jgi:hypothetical protein
MPKMVFISYRRDDVKWQATAVYRALTRASRISTLIQLERPFDRAAPRATSHSRIVRSSEAEARRPSGSTHSALTQAECPLTK